LQIAFSVKEACMPGKSEETRNIEVNKGPATHTSPAQAAAYTYEMLESLRKITSARGLDLLTHLLEIAASEARHQALKDG
jgi:hypothetical protein